MPPDNPSCLLDYSVPFCIMPKLLSIPLEMQFMAAKTRRNNEPKQLVEKFCQSILGAVKITYSVKACRD